MTTEPKTDWEAMAQRYKSHYQLAMNGWSELLAFTKRWNTINFIQVIAFYILGILGGMSLQRILQ